MLRSPGRRAGTREPVSGIRRPHDSGHGAAERNSDGAVGERGGNPGGSSAARGPGVRFSGQAVGGLGSALREYTKCSTRRIWPILPLLGGPAFSCHSQLRPARCIRKAERTGSIPPPYHPAVRFSLPEESSGQNLAASDVALPSSESDWKARPPWLCRGGSLRDTGSQRRGCSRAHKTRLAQERERRRHRLRPATL
jgi:hypothetical protein